MNMQKVFLLIIGFFLVVIGVLGFFPIIFTESILWFNIVNVVLGALGLVFGFKKYAKA